MSLVVYNTLTRRKEPFRPMRGGEVSMFVCGPTVYDLSHVGHAKTYTQFDLVARYLRHRGYRVRYVQNITDVDDKIITRARLTSVEPAQLAAEFERACLDDMAALGNTSVDLHARAHDYIEQITDQVRRLIDRGHAYRLDDGWYFDLSTFPAYGKLSGRRRLTAEDSVSRIDDNPSKRSPGDFALWKARKPGEPFWETELGAGRPGWHIEDTAITEAEFGPQYDLHGGASDLIFPHHEAEIAQMESASGVRPLARYWMHTGLLRIGNAKMSKSAGNFVTTREALRTAEFRTLRFAFLSQHYRSSMELDDQAVAQAHASRQRVENFARLARRGEASPDNTDEVKSVREAFFARMDDDFDTPGALAVLFGHIRSSNREGRVPGASDLALLDEINSLFLAFDLEAGGHDADEARIETMIQKRNAHRAARDFAAADHIRAELSSMGIVLEDHGTGTTWRRESEP